MKTVEKKYYVCEICGKSSTNEEKIKECQEKHRIITDECEVATNYPKGKPVPSDIVISFPDGAKASYYLIYFDDKEVKK